MDIRKEYLSEHSKNKFIFGDASIVLPSILPEYKNKVQLIYLDPPFCSGKTFNSKINYKNVQKKYFAYKDYQLIPEHLPFMRIIILYCYQLLFKKGSLFLHCDYRSNAYLRLILDEIFGSDHLANEIIWNYNSGGRSKQYFSKKHDTILFYRKQKNAYFKIDELGKPRGEMINTHMRKRKDIHGKWVYSINSNGKAYHYSQDSMIFPHDVWSDIPHLHQRNPERCGYPTQKPLALLDRILLSTSQKDSLILDLFSGSGTMAVSSLKNDRSFISIDYSPQSLRNFRRRILDSKLKNKKN